MAQTRIMNYSTKKLIKIINKYIKYIKQKKQKTRIITKKNKIVDKNNYKKIK